MTWVLNDTVVPQTAYEDAQRIKRTGGKCHLMLPENGQIQNPSTCRNCDGLGEVIIETITGGPQMSPMQISPNSGEATTHFDDQWYKRKLTTYPCVVCNGIGKIAVKQDEVREMQL